MSDTIRYRVESTPEPALRPAWAAYLDHHLAEVVLAGRFLGGSVTREGDTFRSEYDAPDRAALDAYVNGPAVALRADSMEKFPAGVTRTRSDSPVTARVSVPFSWFSLGLLDAAGRPVPCPSDGAFTLAYWAPWCGDCADAAPSIVDTLSTHPGRAALVRVYAASDSPAKVTWPDSLTRWHEPSDKDETSRTRTFHAFLRQLEGDRATWGVPSIRRLWIAAGRFVLVG